MRAIVWLVLPWVGIAQVQAPENAPLVTGVLLECDARPAGELSIRAADNRVLRYHFDAKTYVERDERLIDTTRLVTGEKIEVLSDTVAGNPLRYARTIHVIQPVPPPRPKTLGRLRTYDPKAEPKETKAAAAPKPKAGVGGRLRAAADRLRGKSSEDADPGSKKSSRAAQTKGRSAKRTTPQKAG